MTDAPLNITAGTSDFNVVDDHVRSVTDNLWKKRIVKVVAVYPGGAAGPSYVDVQPMVSMADDAGNTYAHGTIHRLPVFRLQAGGAAIILDPVAGDIGEAHFDDRDVSGVKASGAASPPGSRRTHDPADGTYYGGVLNGAATTYVQISGGNVTITGAAIALDGNTTVNGNLTVTGLSNLGGTTPLELSTNAPATKVTGI